MLIFNLFLYLGWRGNAPYGNQYPPHPSQGGNPGPVQTAGAPWVPPAGTPQQPRNPNWDPQQQQQQQPGPPQRYPGQLPPVPGSTYNGTTMQGPPQQWGPPGPQRPYMGPRPPYRPDGKPYAMPPLPGKTLPGAGYPPQPGQLQQQQLQSGTLVYPAKRDSYFPIDCVEAVAPVMTKRRRLCKADVAPVDAWRVYLALKSGLLAESTWAIDVLNILLFDDSSIHYFSLGYMPGLVEVLLEHFRRCLAQIFTTLDDTDMRHPPHSQEQSKGNTKTDALEEAWWTWPKRKAAAKAAAQAAVSFSTVDLGSVSESDMVGQRFRMLDGPDWSMNSRRREKVGIVPRDDELFILDTKKDWDVHDGGFEGVTGIAGIDQWHGGTDISQHIVTHFTAELSIIPFVRLIKDVKKSPEDGSTDADDAVDRPTSIASTNATKKKGRQLETKKERTWIRTMPSPKEETSNSPGETNSTKSVENGCDIKRELVDPTVGSTNNSNSSTTRKTESTLQIRDPHATLKRRKMDDFEDECYIRDEGSLYMMNDSQDQLCRRALALSNIFRSLSFIPGNEADLAKNSTLLVIMGKLLLLHHDHPLRSSHQKNYDREEDVDFFAVDSVFSSVNSGSSARTGPNGKPDPEWWWDTLLTLRENVLVMLANMSGSLDLSIYPEEIVRPLVDGLLHWSVCPSAQAQDPFSSFGPHSSSLLSPQRLCLEALCKLLVMETNMDLILATPPFSRLEKLVNLLTRSLCRTEDQVLREFAINLLYYLSAGDSAMARLIALHNNSLVLLVSFVEQAEANALAVASQHGIQALRENPESMGTSLDMLRRAASTLFHISRHPDSRPLLAKLEQRLLALVMSQIMDQSVAALLSKSLYLCNTDDE